MGAVSDDLVAAIDRAATDAGVSGVVRVDLHGEIVFAAAYGMARRDLGVANSLVTQFATASGSKAHTALAVMRLIEGGDLDLQTTARSVLGNDLPLIDDRVTVEQLLAHRSGIGDYLDEEQIADFNEYVLAVPAHELASTEQFLRVLDGHPMKHEPGAAFTYCNGGYVVLALIAERVSGVGFHDLVDEVVFAPAGLTDTAFLRTDELPGTAAFGYLDDEGLRTNVFHLPVRANGDGGVFTTVSDVHTWWDALFAGRIVSTAVLAEMTRPHSHAADDGMAYGLGFWISESTGAVSVHGFDAGVGFVSAHDPHGRFTYTVLNNKSRGAWPASTRLDALLASRI
jgi:CubicO group peptidase (beta-lactamase class C family)